MHPPPAAASYSKPAPIGGQLIRDVVKFLRAQGIRLPIQSPVLIAVSGGSDSIALALLLIKYGRRIVAQEQLQLIHVNHGWRGKASDEDAAFVQSFGEKLKIPVQVIQKKSKMPAPGDSWEEEARQTRKQVFAKATHDVGKKAIVLTAHQAEDLAETALWRLLTGAVETHGGGVLIQHENEIRPLLKTRKAVLRAFLQEEGQSWREDQTNHEGRFLRSRLRQEVFPVLGKIFPKSVEHLVEWALQAQKKQLMGGHDEVHGDADEEMKSIWTALELKIRRPHWLALRNKASRADWTGEIQLSRGWKLVKTKIKGH